MTKADDRISGPEEIWVCQACGRTKEGDRYDFNDISCMLNAILCFKEKGCKCVARTGEGEPCKEPHWVPVNDRRFVSPTTEDAGSQ